MSDISKTSAQTAGALRTVMKHFTGSQLSDTDAEPTAFNADLLLQSDSAGKITTSGLNPAMIAPINNPVFTGAVTLGGGENSPGHAASRGYAAGLVAGTTLIMEYKTAAFTAEFGTNYIVTTASPIEVTLPIVTAADVGKVISFRNTHRSDASITLASASGETLPQLIGLGWGSATLTLGLADFIRLVAVNFEATGDYIISWELLSNHTII